MDKPLPIPTSSSAAAAGGFAGYSSSAMPRQDTYSNPYETGYSNTPLRGDEGNRISGVKPGISQRDSLAYQNVPSETYWPTNEKSEPFTPKKSRKKLWWTLGIVLGVIAVVGIVVGVVVSQLKKNTTNGNSSSSGSNSGSGSGVLSNPNDPSVFTKDSRLHQSMWGIAYTPQVRFSLSSCFSVPTLYHPIPPFRPACPFAPLLCPPKLVIFLSLSKMKQRADSGIRDLFLPIVELFRPMSPEIFNFYLN